MTRELVMYNRRAPCPWVVLAKQTLQLHGVAWREVMIDDDDAARQRLLDWVGFLSVPTLVVAAPGSDLPLEAPAPLAEGLSPRGIDRGSLITEPGMAQLSLWLQRNGLLDPAGLASHPKHPHRTRTGTQRTGTGGHRPGIDSNAPPE